MANGLCERDVYAMLCRVNSIDGGSKVLVLIGCDCEYKKSGLTRRPGDMRGCIVEGAHHYRDCILKIYEMFEPERLSTQIVACIVITALMSMPAPDFNLCLFLIPERVTARFGQFWYEATNSRHLLDSVPGYSLGTVCAQRVANTVGINECIVILSLKTSSITWYTYQEKQV